VDAVNRRLACLITGSVILHAAALAPLKVRTTPSRHPFAPLMSVDLVAHNAPPAAPRVPVANAPVVTTTPLATPPAPQPHTPISDAPPAAPVIPAPIEQIRPLPAPQPAGETTPPVSETTLNAGSQQQNGVRLAVPDEVDVHVQLLSFAVGETPKDTLQIEDRTYTYFKSPGLRRAAQPLDDIKPHYPAQKPQYVNGAVRLQLLIDEGGRLEQANVLCSNPDFEKSALASVEHLRFTPALAVSGPVKSYMVVEFSYGRGYPCAPVPDLSPSR
jgi:TonB family protein